MYLSYRYVKEEQGIERVKAFDQDEVRSTPHRQWFYQAAHETQPTRPSLGVGDHIILSYICSP
jgi:hypothetical protein